MNDENRPSSIEQCIFDIAECPICNEVLQDNRCLPCLHMFCLKCLESYRKGKPKGKPLPCPVCRKEFSILKSIADLPRNFFIDKLLDAHKIKKKDVLPKICEICIEDPCKRRSKGSLNKIEDTDVSLATRFCCDCRQYLCLSCERQHKRITATSMHTIIDSTNASNPQELIPRPTYCIAHKTKEAEVYCQDCKLAICWQCKALLHNDHVSLDISSAMKDLAAKLEEHIEQISGHLHTKQDHIRKLTECQKLYTDEIEVESAKICREQRMLCRNITDNGDKLKKALTASTTVHWNAFKALRDKLETDVAELNKHKVYIEQMIHLGNVSDLCEYTNTLMSKTAELAEEHTCRIIVPPVAHLAHADLHDLLTGKRTNIDHQYSEHLVDNADKSNVNNKQHKDQLSPTDQSKGSFKDWRKTTSSVTLNSSRNSDTIETREIKRSIQPSKRITDEASSKCKDWSLIGTMTPENDRTVCGITVLGSMFYVVLQDSNTILVYSATELVFINKLTVYRLVNPNDIVSCKFNYCLYICDWGTACIFRVKVREEMEEMNWSTERDMGCLSVTTEHTILMAGYISSKLKEYTSNGELIRSIELGNGLKPWHAIKLDCTNTRYLICQGDNFSAFHRVCLLDLKYGMDRMVKFSFGGVKGSDEQHLCGPYHLAVDKSGCILVNDCNNSRVLLLSQDLKFIKEIIPSSSNVLRRARRMYLDEDTSRLYVADNAKSGSETTAGRILVFSNSNIVTV